MQSPLDLCSVEVAAVVQKNVRNIIENRVKDGCGRRVKDTREKQNTGYSEQTKLRVISAAPFRSPISPDIYWQERKMMAYETRQIITTCERSYCQCGFPPFISTLYLKRFPGFQRSRNFCQAWADALFTGRCVVVEEDVDCGVCFNILYCPTAFFFAKQYSVLEMTTLARKGLS